MREDFLHYVWKFKKFDSTSLTTSSGDSITIINCGQYLQLSGPDFFNAQIIIGDQKWAGNIEIHIKSSDWYLHHHENDSAYENVILHVVWEHDVAVYRSSNVEIPVLVLKNYVAHETVSNYLSLLAPKSWIFCEDYLRSIDPFIIEKWEERLLFERLEKKADTIWEILRKNGNDWEAAFFCILAKNFGLNTNGEAFLRVAESIPFSVIRKERFEYQNIEALLFGQAGLLDNEKQDVYFSELKSRYDYLTQKHSLTPMKFKQVEFFKHRPDNFPTIRISQFAQIYISVANIFTKVIELKLAADFYLLFNVGVSLYWQSHYQFDNESPVKPKKISRSFVDLLLINSIIPIKFAYAKYHEKDISESLIALLSSLSPENNAVIDKFSSFSIKANSAFETQALLQLKNEYCNRKRCLECAFGAWLMKSSDTQQNR